MQINISNDAIFKNIEAIDQWVGNIFNKSIVDAIIFNNKSSISL
jgi:hypothetical protein